MIVFGFLITIHFTYILELDSLSTHCAHLWPSLLLITFEECFSFLFFIKVAKFLNQFHLLRYDSVGYPLLLELRWDNRYCLKFLRFSYGFGNHLKAIIHSVLAVAGHGRGK